MEKLSLMLPLGRSTTGLIYKDDVETDLQGHFFTSDQETTGGIPQWEWVFIMSTDSMIFLISYNSMMRIHLPAPKNGLYLVTHLQRI